MSLSLAATGMSQGKPIAFSLSVFFCSKKQKKSTNVSRTDRWHQHTDYKINRDLWHNYTLVPACFARQQNMATSNVISNSNHRVPARKCQKSRCKKRLQQMQRNKQNRTGIKCNRNETLKLTYKKRKKLETISLGI